MFVGLLEKPSMDKENMKTNKQTSKHPNLQNFPKQLLGAQTAPGVLFTLFLSHSLSRASAGDAVYVGHEKVVNPSFSSF